MRRLPIEATASALLAGLFLVGAANTVWAQNGRQERDRLALLQSIGIAPGQSACFGRAYDRAHLASHPDQLVTSMRLLVHRRSASAANRQHLGDEPFDMRMSVTIRGRSEVFRTTASCRWNDNSAGYSAALLCMVDCDGGGLALQTSQIRNAIRVRLDYPLGRIAMSESCETPEGNDVFVLNAGKDDKEFRLDRTRANECNFLER
jgi:hypothetical protein